MFTEQKTCSLKKNLFRGFPAVLMLEVRAQNDRWGAMHDIACKIMERWTAFAVVCPVRRMC